MENYIQCFTENKQSVFPEQVVILQYGLIFPVVEAEMTPSTANPIKELRKLNTILPHLQKNTFSTFNCVIMNRY